MSNIIHEFTITVGDDEITALSERLSLTRWPDRIPDTGWDYGVDADWVRDLADYWANGFDWRTAEAGLNSFDHVITEIDGQKIHAIHQRSPNPDALPLLISHGWPGSVVEFLEIIGPLTDPAAYGGNPADAFHVIAPSLPGYAWSGPTTERGWGPTRTAKAFAGLARRLGYDRYAVQGGDWGSIISQEIARNDPDHVVGCHVNMVTTQPPGEPDDMEDITPYEQQLFDRVAWYQAEDNGYFRIQQTRPQTLGTGLNDSPAGLLAWIGEKFYGWTDHDGDPFTAVDRDTILTNVSIYWFTKTINSSTRMYFELIPTIEVGFGSTGAVPLGVSVFPKELFAARRRWVEKSHDVIFWAEHDRGGHFAALEKPDILVADIRDCFRDLR